MGHQQSDELAVVVGDRSEQRALIAAIVGDPAQLRLVLGAKRQAARLGDVGVAWRVVDRLGVIVETVDIDRRLNFGMIVGRFVALTGNEGAGAGMAREPCARPYGRVFIWVEMLDQLKRAVAVLARPAREVMELPVRIDAEAAFATEPIIAGSIGDDVPAGRAGDVDHEAIEPGVLGGRQSEFGHHASLQEGAPRPLDHPILIFEDALYGSNRRARIVGGVMDRLAELKREIAARTIECVLEITDRCAAAVDLDLPVIAAVVFWTVHRPSLCPGNCLDIAGPASPGGACPL